MIRAFAAVLLLFALATGGCRAVVGDSCDADSDCGRGLFCERSLPGGYCTIDDCDRDGCPDEGVCIVFDAATSYCMKPCDGGGDCRDDYLCVEDFGAHPFCHAYEPPADEGE